MADARRDAAEGRAQFDRAGVRIFCRDTASSYGWWGNLAVVLGRRPPELAHVVNYRATVVELHRRFPGGVGLITVVRDTSLPSTRGRDAMVKMFKEVWPLMRGALFVPDATGFKAAALRGVMGCLILAAGQRDRVKVVASVPEGINWLAKKLVDNAGPELGVILARQISEFCEREARDDLPLVSAVSVTREAKA